MGSPVTTNPITIMLINMTVVFVVLFGLSLIIRLIKVVDPTQKKKLVEPVRPGPTVVEQTAGLWDEDEEAAVIIAAAVAACGYGVVSVTAVRPEISRAWRQAGRLEAVGKSLQAVQR